MQKTCVKRLPHSATEKSVPKEYYSYDYGFDTTKKFPAGSPMEFANFRIGFAQENEVDCGGIVDGSQFGHITTAAPLLAGEGRVSFVELGKDGQPASLPAPHVG